MAPSLPSALQASVSGLSGQAHPRSHLGQGRPYPTRGGRPVRALSWPDPQRQSVPGTWLIPKDRDPWWPQPSRLAQFMQPPTRMPAMCSPCAPNGGLTLGGPWRWATSRLGSGGSSLGGEGVPSSEKCWVYRERQVTAVTPQLPDSHGAGSAPVHLTIQSWGLWMFRVTWPCVGVEGSLFPKGKSAQVHRPASLCCNSQVGPLGPS